MKNAYEDGRAVEEWKQGQFRFASRLVVAAGSTFWKTTVVLGWSANWHNAAAFRRFARNNWQPRGRQRFFPPPSPPSPPPVVCPFFSARFPRYRDFSHDFLGLGLFLPLPLPPTCRRPAIQPLFHSSFFLGRRLRGFPVPQFNSHGNRCAVFFYLLNLRSLTDNNNNYAV